MVSIYLFFHCFIPLFIELFALLFVLPFFFIVTVIRETSEYEEFYKDLRFWATSFFYSLVYIRQQYFSLSFSVALAI